MKERVSCKEASDANIDISVKLSDLLATEHGTDRVETILDIEKNELRITKVASGKMILLTCGVI